VGVARPRRIVEDERFTEERRKYFSDAMWPEIREGLEKTIAIDPEIGHRLPAAPGMGRVFESEEAPGWGMIRLRFVYVFDEENVHLLWTEPAD
jgi:hypothetical protein